MGVTMQQLNARAHTFRQAIAGFIAARKDEKLKNPEKDAISAQKYDYATWLADAARRVNQLQAATHIAKATHSSAGGSSLYVPPENLPCRAEIGTHMLKGMVPIDVVGNAAALDVFKFLKTQVEGKTLLAWAERGDADLKAALSDNPQIAEAWVKAFTGLVAPSSNAQSHALMKQIYWLTGENPLEDSNFCLLQPVFSSALAHIIHAEIQETRFGEQNTEARNAFYKKQPYDGAYKDYKGLAVRKLGGTKPQNVSQLNSERGGVNYLFASLPPTWQSQYKPPVLNRTTVLSAFFKTKEAFVALQKLAQFLKSDPAPNVETRQKRTHLEQEIAFALVEFAALIKSSLPAGWSRAPACELALCEKLWLDPERSTLPENDEFLEDDRLFKEAYVLGDWPDEVAQRFANELNALLRKAGLVTVGNTEYEHWVQQVMIEAAWPVPVRRRVKEKI